MQILPHHLLMNVSDAVIACDLQLKVTAWNPAAERLYGWAEAEALGQLMEQIVRTEQTHQQQVQAQADLIAKGSWRGEVIQYHKDGQPIEIESHVSLIKTETGTVIGMVGINRDISLQKQMAKEHQALLEEKHRANLLRHFLGNSRHDLITPISSLKTGLYLLQKTDLDEKGGHYVERMTNQVDKLHNLLGSMLTMLDLDEIHPHHLSMESRDINQIVMELVEELNCPQHVQLELAAHLPKLMLDYSHLKRAIQEVLQNAIAHTPMNSQITLRSYTQTDWLMLEVEDNGIGIPTDEQERIFQLFYRVDMARNTDQGGMGMGLALVKKIIDYHQGRVEVESEFGQGSIFRFVLPINYVPERLSMLIKT